MRRLTALLVLVLSFVLSPTLVQAVEPTEGVTQADIVEIVSSDDPEAAFAALSPTQQVEAAAMITEELEATEVVGATAPLGSREAKALGLKPPKDGSRVSAAVAGGCWYHYYFTYWTLWGIDTASSWMQLNWCGSNGRITSWSFSNVGGSGTVLSYDGNTRGATNVGWEVRGVTTHKFSFWLGSVTKCMQVRGGATGLYSRSISCSAN